MGDFTALTAAVASLTAAVASNTAAVADVTVVVANLKTGTDQAAIDAVNASIGTVITQMSANTAALEALVPVPVVVTPPSS